MWGQLAVKALVSGILIAAASEIARRNPGWGGLIASLPLTTLLALTWLWRDTRDPVRAADFVAGTAIYVAAALPALALIAWLLRRETGFGLALGAGCMVAVAGYVLLNWAGRRWGLPV